MYGTAPAPDISDVGRTSRRYESEGERQEINKLACEASQPLLEGNKQAIQITHRKEDLKLSESDRGVIALNVYSPIRQLSDDVLCHIFKLYCKDSLPLILPLNRPVHGALPQITLSRVCSAWREIMFDVPTFWSSIRIAPKKFGTPQFFDSTVKAANAWLSRAKGLPCSIDVDFPEPVSDAKTEDLCRSLWEMDWVKNIIKNLISLHRFKRLGVPFSDHHLRELLQLPDDRLSCVEDLSIRYTSKDNTTFRHMEIGLHKLSNLTSFSLSHNPFSPYSRTDPPAEGYFHLVEGIPWHNLRNIHLHAPMPISYCFDALHYSGRFAILETCSLIIAGDDGDDDASNDTSTFSPQAPVHLFQLRELKVTVCSRSRKDEILEFFLLSLRFPKLKSLALGSVDYGDMSIDPQMLLRVQDASQIHLEELSISGSTPAIDARTFMTSFPSLRRLELPYNTTFTDEAMIEVGAGSIGVFLEDLTINKPRLDIEKLLQMVKARSQADGKHRNKITEFKSVTLYCDKAEHEVEENVLRFIEEIKLSGVDLNVIFMFVPQQRHYEEWEQFVPQPHYEEWVVQFEYSDYGDEPYDEEEIYSFL